MIIRIGKLELNDWVAYGETDIKYSFFRKVNGSDYSWIGINILSFDPLEGRYPRTLSDLDKCSWVIDGVCEIQYDGLIYNLIDKYCELYGRIEYSYSEIEQTKHHFDKFLIKNSKLFIFF